MSYASERNRLLYGDKNAADHSRLRHEVVETWPYSPELISLLEDNIMMADAAQETRDLIRVLAEVFRARGHDVPVVTAADFHIDNDECGVITLIDSVATTADQEQIRDRAQQNLEAINEAGIDALHAREVISGTAVSPATTLGMPTSLSAGCTRGNPVWMGMRISISEELLAAALGHCVYAICFESVDQGTAERLHESLVDSASYLGAMEVDDGSFIHWQLYSKELIPKCRVLDRAARVFWDGISEDGKDPGFFE